VPRTPTARLDGETEMLTNGTPTAEARLGVMGTESVSVKARKAATVVRVGSERMVDIDDLRRSAASAAVTGAV